MGIRYTAIVIGVLAGILSGWLCPIPSAGATEVRAPLLQPGKTTLYQRVFSHPGAKLLDGPSASANVTHPLTPFSVLYIYDQKDGFSEVGASSSNAQGWVDSNSLTEWPQALTLRFSDRTGRSPLLFFRDEKVLTELCEADDMLARLQNIYDVMQRKEAGGAMPENFPVLAAEPSDTLGAVARQRFYLIPIKQVENPFDETQFLKVASIDPGTGVPAARRGRSLANPTQVSEAPLQKTAIAFVIDTTISMNPYIQQSLNVIREVFDFIEKENLTDIVDFGIVTFRNSTEARPNIEYRTRIVSDFTSAKNRKNLENSLSQVREATASTHSFNEDSMAGIKEAVDNLSWNAYHSRLLVLITDAGPLPDTDSYLSTKMNPAAMSDHAATRNIWLTALHIRCPTGAKFNDHVYAENAYRGLTRRSDNLEGYIPINAPTPKQGAEEFGRATEVLAEGIARMARATSQGVQLQPPVAIPANNASPEERARYIAEAIGYAMQLDFLGQVRENQAPHVATAWIADMDLTLLAQGRKVPAVDVAVLLNKNQLSDLQRQLQIIIDNAERTRNTDARDFFQSIRDASLQMVRDPSAFSQQPGKNLRELGVLGEFLEGLPYKSAVMLLQEDDWYRKSVGEQTAFINRLRSLIARYEEYDKDRDNWEGFGSPNAGDWVYPVPLAMLP